MIFLTAPLICSTFKGVLPSDLVEKYSQSGGMARMEIDLCVAAEIGDRINEASRNNSKDQRGKGGGARARMLQRREQAKALKEQQSINE